MDWVVYKAFGLLLGVMILELTTVLEKCIDTKWCVKQDYTKQINNLGPVENEQPQNAEGKSRCDAVTRKKKRRKKEETRIKDRVSKGHTNLAGVLGSVKDGFLCIYIIVIIKTCRISLIVQ